MIKKILSNLFLKYFINDPSLNCLILGDSKNYKRPHPFVISGTVMGIRNHSKIIYSTAWTDII